MDNRGNRQESGYGDLTVTHKRDDSWLGGAIAVQDNGERLLACAPRWRNSHYSKFYKYYLMNGACYLSGSDISPDSGKKTLLPLNDQEKQGDEEIYIYVFGQAGFSAHFPKNSTDFVLGAPGVFFWQGTIIRYRNPKLNDGGMKAEIATDIPFDAVRTYSYLGYSLSSGRFLNESSRHIYVAGAPRNDDSRGKVYVFDFRLDNSGLQIMKVLEGTQMGEYFGGALCVVDLNGDSLDDLVIAAPQYSLQAANSAQFVGDEGRIYVYINGDHGSFTEITGERMIMGSRRYGARFGTAVANVGDLNMDGYEDIAVGAPYEDMGAVYIYHGDKTGIVFEPVQKILAQNIHPRLKGFGISFSNSADIDGNHYNDVAVGAYESGHAVVLRGQPIITFQPHLSTSTSRISLNTSNFSSTACLSYTGSYVPNTVDAIVTMTVDLAYDRAQFVSEKFSTTSMHVYEVTLRGTEPQCKEFQIAIKPSTKDPTRPLDVVMKFELSNNSNAGTVNTGRQESSTVPEDFCLHCPVVDAKQPTYVTNRVAFETGCKRDICEPDLIARARFVGIKEQFILGEQPTLQVEVEVLNVGEPAFLTQAFLSIPRITPLVRIPPTCQDATDKFSAETHVLVCDFGNPLEHNYTINVLMNTQDVPFNTKTLNFAINATSAGNEVNPDNNYKELLLPIIIEADMTITGFPSQDQVVYVMQNNSIRKDLALNHTFEVWNAGPSKVETVMVEIEIPHQLEGPNGELIFMDVFEPQTSMQSSTGTVTCLPEEPFYYYKPEGPSKEDVMVEVDPTVFADHDFNESTVVQYSIVSKRSVNTEGLEEESEYPTSSPNFSPPPSNRTLYLSCSNQKVDCFKVKCFAGPFTPNKSRAIINFKLKPSLQTLEHALDKKDIILFSSRGKVKIVNPVDSIQHKVNRPDRVSVHTIFHGKIPEGSVATWIIVLAIIVGVLILFLITMALHKMGFFKRKEKEELEALTRGQDEALDSGD